MVELSLADILTAAGAGTPTLLLGYFYFKKEKELKEERESHEATRLLFKELTDKVLAKAGIIDV